MDNHRHIPEYLDEMRDRGLAPGTIRLYGQILLRFRDWAPTDINTATEADVKGYLRRIRGSGVHLRDVAGVLKRYYDWLGVTPNPLADIKRKKPPKRPILPITADEFMRIREAAKPRIRNLLTFLLATGVRISEALGARRADFILDRMDRGQPRPIFVVRGKGGKTRTVPLTSAGLVSWLDDRLTVSDGPFAGMHYWQARYGFNEAAVRAGVQRVAWETNGIRGMYATLHGIRRLAATRMLEREIPIDVIASILGHASMETTRRYAQTSEHRIWQHVEQVSGGVQ